MQALASEPVFHRCVGASASRVEQALTSLPTRFEQCMQTWQSADSSWVQRRLPGMCCSLYAFASVCTNDGGVVRCVFIGMSWHATW